MCVRIVNKEKLFKKMQQNTLMILLCLLFLLFQSSSDKFFQTKAAETYQLQTLTGYKGNGQDVDRTFTAKHAFLKAPCGICSGNNDEIFVSDCARGLIFKIFPNESMIVFGGLGLGFNQDGYDVKQTLFNSPSSLSVAINGDLWIADTNNDKIRLVSAETNLVSSLPFAFNKPLGVYVSNNNILYIAGKLNISKFFDCETCQKILEIT